jgi:hypothetical protein
VGGQQGALDVVVARCVVEGKAAAATVAVAAAACAAARAARQGCHQRRGNERHKASIRAVPAAQGQPVLLHVGRHGHPALPAREVAQPAVAGCRGVVAGVLLPPLLVLPGQPHSIAAARMLVRVLVLVLLQVGVLLQLVLLQQQLRISFPQLLPRLVRHQQTRRHIAACCVLRRQPRIWQAGVRGWRHCR